jgi:hypothetical protein
MRDAAATRNERHDARDVSGLDVPVHGFADPLEPLSRKPDVLGRCARY